MIIGALTLATPVYFYLRRTRATRTPARRIQFKQQPGSAASYPLVTHSSTPDELEEYAASLLRGTARNVRPCPWLNLHPAKMV